MQGSDGNIDPNLLKQFNGLDERQKQIVVSGTLPPAIADVPPHILRDTGFFDGLPRVVQIQLGVIGPDEIIPTSPTKVAQVLDGGSPNNAPGANGIDPNIIAVLQTNPTLIKLLQGPDGNIDPNLIQQFNGLDERQKQIVVTGTLPPAIADVPPHILRDTGFFDGLPRAVQIQLGVIDPDEIIPTSSPKHKNSEIGQSQEKENRRKPKQHKLFKGKITGDGRKRSRLAAIKRRILKRVNETGTLPPRLRKVPNSVLKQIRLFDKLPKNLQVQLGLVDAETTDKGLIEENIIKERNNNLATGSLKWRRRIGSPLLRKLYNDKLIKNNVLMDRFKPKPILQSAKNVASNNTEMDNNGIIPSNMHAYGRRNMLKIHFKKFDKKWRPFGSRTSSIPSVSSPPHFLPTIKRHITRKHESKSYPDEDIEDVDNDVYY